MPAPRRTPICARVAIDGAPVADSTATRRVEVPDGPPRLWFPRRDVDDDALAGLDPALWTAGTGELVDHVAFDHDRLDVTLIDPVGPDERDVTIKRFPTWGDAADLVEIMDVAPDGELRYRSVARSDWRRPVVEGSQMLGQAIVAAGRHHPGRRAVSASMAFVRSADAGRDYHIELEEISAGRTFAAVIARSVQGGRTCGAGIVLVDTTAPPLITHADPPPVVPGPYESVPYDMSVTGRDLRVVDSAYDGDPDAPVGPPVLDAWVRFRGLPDDPALHAGLVAQFTGHMSIAAALRPHAGIGQHQAHRTISTAINAISISFHADVRADQWLLYHHRSTVASDGMTHSECRIHDESGSLVASFTVDAMVRPFASTGHSTDERTAL